MAISVRFGSTCWVSLFICKLLKTSYEVKPRNQSSDHSVKQLKDYIYINKAHSCLCDFWRCMQKLFEAIVEADESKQLQNTWKNTLIIVSLHIVISKKWSLAYLYSTSLLMWPNYLKYFLWPSAVCIFDSLLLLYGSGKFFFLFINYLKSIDICSRDKILIFLKKLIMITKVTCGACPRFP